MELLHKISFYCIHENSSSIGLILASIKNRNSLMDFYYGKAGMKNANSGQVQPVKHAYFHRLSEAETFPNTIVEIHK